MSTTRGNLAGRQIEASLPGPNRKRTPSPYSYRLTYQAEDGEAAGCALMWDVIGGREVYQIVLERTEDGRLRWHCTCADAVYRGERSAHRCKHVRGLQNTGRQKPEPAAKVEPQAEAAPMQEEVESSS